MDSDGERSAGRGAPADQGAARTLTGTVVEQLPAALYRVRLEDSGTRITAHIADRMDRNFIRLLVGDRVRIELSPLDVTRGRIVEKIT